MTSNARITFDDVKKLRKEIVLGSLFLSDYKNSLGIDKNSARGFFDGYLEFLGELMEEDGVEDCGFWRQIDSYDNEENLEEWFFCFDECPLIFDGDSLASKNTNRGLNGG